MGTKEVEQELLGHRDVRATMIYTHVLNKGGQQAQSAKLFRICGFFQILLFN